MGLYVIGVIYASIAALVFATWRLRRKRGAVGPAAGAMMEQLLDDNRRGALEVILEERTGARDPEDRDGNLPDLAGGQAERQVLS